MEKLRHIWRGEAEDGLQCQQENFEVDTEFYWGQ